VRTIDQVKRLPAASFAGRFHVGRANHQGRLGARCTENTAPIGRKVLAIARRRYERARDAAGLPPLRFHDLRHTYGSLLVAGGVDIVSVKSAMGHPQIGTTERYLHARPATELADRFTGGVSAARADADARVP
jgi:integrase